MRAIWTVATRELFSFFVSPMAYVVLTVWLLYFGSVFFLLAMFFSQQPPGGGADLLQAFFGGTTLYYVPLLVFVPVMTMRLLAEERSSGTIESLMTAPVTEIQIVLGKYVASVVFWLALWLPTLSYVWLASGTGEDVIDWGAIASTYVGLFIIGLFYMAVGTFMSAVAKNQIVAAMLTFLVLAIVFVVGIFSYATSDDSKRAVFEYLGLWSQMASFAKGVVDTRYVVYDLSVACLFVFMSVRVLQASRWE